MDDSLFNCIPSNITAKYVRGNTGRGSDFQTKAPSGSEVPQKFNISQPHVFENKWISLS